VVRSPVPTNTRRFAFEPIVDDARDDLSPTTMKHADLRWNPATQEWYCPRCGRTSDHLQERDAEIKLEQFECKLPSQNTVKNRS
jgi:hypothetical protein